MQINFIKPEFFIYAVTFLLLLLFQSFANADFEQVDDSAVNYVEASRH